MLNHKDIRLIKVLITNDCPKNCMDCPFLDDPGEFLSCKDKYIAWMFNNIKEKENGVTKEKIESAKV